MFPKIDFSSFPPEREQRLKEIYRFNMFEVLMYRSNLWMHTHRVAWLVEELLPLAQKYFTLDPEKTRVLALVHDDAEMITGDVQAGHKARMTKEELEKVANSEEDALKALARKYPKMIHGYAYEDLLRHSLRKDCIEAQVVSYADKIDAQCESLHEVLAGNISLLRAINFYTNAFTQFPKKFPDLVPLLQEKGSSLTYLTDVVHPDKVEIKRYTHLGKPHTKESLEIDTDFPFYNTWRRIVIRNGGEEGIGWLLRQKENI
jgi:5'-deoxynucleotidase YfbR-like HD superfamily hydrolase